MEDNDILVVHKHAGMAVQNARMGQMDLEHALLNYLAEQTRTKTPGQARTQIPYLAVVHRLDQPVEGVLVFAKKKDAAGKLGRQVQDGTMKKEYLAVCEGKMEKQGVQRLEDFLVKDARSNTSRVVQPGTAGAKKAVLEYEVVQAEENRTLVQIHLGTGRHHQIRVQFSHAGYPLAGDVKYGAKEKGSLALCAHRLELKHPRTGRLLTFTVKPESEMFDSFG
ncbi:RluA family pseudouridine synthase [Fusicatenibacter sp.]